jgi:hypothetical protein
MDGAACNSRGRARSRATSSSKNNHRSHLSRCIRRMLGGRVFWFATGIRAVAYALDAYPVRTDPA